MSENLSNFSKYTFFWKGVFSQWHPATFSTEGKTFNCAEQYMMYQKALLFEDQETAEKIMNTKNPFVQKKLGRTVKPFDKNIWNNNARIIVYRGNYEKFTQNKDLLKKLLSTKETLLVEASPYDKVWGIGLDEQKAKKVSAEKWPGKNWLGEVLTNLREDLLVGL